MIPPQIAKLFTINDIPTTGYTNSKSIFHYYINVINYTNVYINVFIYHLLNIISFGIKNTFDCFKYI